jgi:hypothetical protein
MKNKNEDQMLVGHMYREDQKADFVEVNRVINSTSKDTSSRYYAQAMNTIRTFMIGFHHHEVELSSGPSYTFPELFNR